MDHSREEAPVANFNMRAVEGIVFGIFLGIAMASLVYLFATSLIEYGKHLKKKRGGENHG